MCVTRLLEALHCEIAQLVESEIKNYDETGCLTHKGQADLHILLENCKHLKEYHLKNSDMSGDIYAASIEHNVVGTVNL